MIIKILGCICVILTCFCMGEFFIEREKERIYLLKEMRKMGELWKGSIRQGTFNLIETMNLIQNKLDARVGRCLDNICSLLRKNNEDTLHNIWSRCMDEELKKTTLNTTDIDIIKNLGDIMGCFDKELQLINLENYIVELNELMEGLEKELDDKKRLYKTVSVMAGIFIIIIFIH